MKTDTYTKIILTIIAACLSIIVVKNLEIVPKAHANFSPHSQAGVVVPVNEDGSINVRFNPMETMDVNIKKISTWDVMPIDIKKVSSSDELNVNIDEVNGNSIYGTRVPVEIKD